MRAVCSNACVNGSTDKLVTLADVARERLVPGTTVFVATNNAAHSMVQDLRREFLRQGFGLVDLDTLATQHASLRRLLEPLTATQISIIEQVVVAYSTRYLGIFESSWDEFVYQVRFWLNLPGA